MVIVYRVEYPGDGIGPYKDKIYDGPDDWKGRPRLPIELAALAQKLYKKHNLSKYHPCISGDLTKNCRQWTDWDDFCGFPSIRAARRWFLGFFVDLRLAGYNLVAYRVAKKYIKVGASGRQLAFPKSKAKVIEALSI